jgi:CTP:molybdopterin cytidylyltransferase MocA
MTGEKKKWGGLILAGGASRRMGRWKAALPWEAKQSLLQVHQQHLTLAGADALAVVVAQQYMGEAKPLLAKKSRVLEQPDPDAPLFASFLLGLQELTRQLPDLHAVAMTPVDCLPLIPGDIKAMAKLAKQRNVLAVRPCAPREEGGLRYGHPLILQRPALDELLQLDPATGRIDLWLRDLSPEKQRGFALDDPQWLLNMNTPDAYETGRAFYLRQLNQMDPAE